MIEALGGRVDSEQHRVDLVFTAEGDGPVNVVSGADAKRGASATIENLVESFEHIIGVSESAAKDEKITATATATPNSWNKRPVLPSMKESGTNTATSVTVVAITANAICLVP